MKRLAASIGLAFFLLAGDVSAFCYAAICPDGSSGTLCAPASETDCEGGIPLQWTSFCTNISVQKDASAQVDLNTMSALTAQAFATWTQADCGGGAVPSMHVEYFGSVACDSVEYNKQAGNANVVVFRDATWPHADDGHSVALTTTTFDPNNGRLLDADIEINSASFAITTTDVTEGFDLLAILTHEAGHFLGLAHSASEDASMFALYQAGSIEARSLSEDDRGAICSLYAPGSKNTSCNPLPRHGFSSDCAGEQTEGTCAFAAPSKSRDARGLAALLALVACGAWARRRRSAR